MAEHAIQEWMEARNKPLIDQTKKRNHHSDLENSISERISEAIQVGKLTVSLLVQNLSTYTDDDDDLIGVSRALELLLAVFERIRKIPENEMTFLIDYLVTRVKNEQNTPTKNAGLRNVVLLFKTLSMIESFNLHASSTIIESIFSLADNRLRFKDLPDSVRLDVYNVVDYFLRNFSQDLVKSLGYSQIVTGLSELVNFEKKASCLLVIFPLISYISQTWNLASSELENLFSSFIRYFPIKISGLQDDALRLSNEMSSCLSECIVSNNFYASLAFPYLIQRIDDHTTISATSMHEILMTIDICVKKYSSETVAQWSSKIWDALKFEIWNDENEDHIKDSLQILRSTITSLEYRGSDDKFPEKNYSVQFLGQIVTQCRDRIVDLPQKYLSCTGRILYSIASNSSNAVQLIAKKILPTLTALWQDVASGQIKKMILTVVGYILKAFAENLDFKDTLLDRNAMDMINTLATFRKSLVQILLNAVVEMKRIMLDKSGSEEDLTSEALNFVPSLECLVFLFRVPSFLTGIEIEMILQELIQITIKSRTCVIHDEGLLALKNISIYRPTVFTHMILPSLLDELPDFIISESKQQIKDKKEISFTLNDMTEISCHPALRELDDGFPEGSTSNYQHRNFDSFVSCLLNKIESLFLIRGQVPYCTLCIAAIYKGLKLFDEELESSKIAYTTPDPRISPYEPLWIQIINKSLQSIHYSEHHPFYNTKRQHLIIRKLQNEGDVLDEKFLHFAGNILLLIARSKLSTADNNIVFKFYKGSHFLNMVGIPTEDESLVDQDLDLAYGPEFMDEPSVCLVSIYLLVGVQPVPDDDRFLTKTKCRLSINGDVGNFAVTTVKKLLDADMSISPQVRIAMLYFIQILVAKFHCSRDELKAGGKLIDFITSLARAIPGKSIEYIQNFYQMIVYVTTASFACFDRKIIDPLFGLLSEALDPKNCDPRICTLVAKSFRMILADSYILNKKNYLQIRTLRKGYILQLIKPLFIEYQSHSRIMGENTHYNEKAKENYLIAIVGILKNLEDSLILDQLNTEELVNLALDGTTISTDDWAKAEYIKLVRMLVVKRSNYMKNCVDNIVERMIERTHSSLEKPSDANFECRILALEVLRLIIENFGSSLLLSRRVKLISELAIAKDDYHTGVRQAAAQCSLALVYVKA